jgi:hypothetical protein
MNSFKYYTGRYHSEIIGINTTNIELILLVFMGDIISQWLAMYIYFTSVLATVFIYCTPILTLIYVYYNWWIWYSYLYNTVFSWTGTNIHGLDRHRRYIYLYLKLWFSRKRRKLLQQNRAWITGCSCIYFLSIRFSNCSDVVALYYFYFIIF